MGDKISDSTILEMLADADREQDKNLVAFVSYWQSMRIAGDVPQRANIDPRGITPLLENAFVAEKIAPGLARLRIAGSHMSDLMGMEVRGMPVSAFITPDQRTELADMIVDLFDAPATLRAELISDTTGGSQTLRGTLIMLPLRSDLGDISRALGCLISHGPIGRAPRRFRMTRKIVQRITLEENPLDHSHCAPGMAETPAAFRHDAPLGRNERPYLRLVK